MKKALIGLMAAALIMGCAKNDESGYIGRSDIQIEDGVLSPEALLALGRLSDPQISPDGSRILYGVSYTSVADNKSCRNLFICNADGSGNVQLTRYAKSVSCARWNADGSAIYFIQGGQIWKAPVNGNKLGKKVQVSDVPAGISEFALSPDCSQLMYISTIKNPLVDQAKDIDAAYDKAQAYATEDLMYRHWDHWVTEIPRTYISTLVNGMVTPESSFDLLGSEPYELPTEPFGGCEQLSWAPNGRYVAYSCRKLTGKQYAFSTCTNIYIYDILTGETIPVTTKGGYDTDPAWSPDGSRLAWISMERDGYEADRQRLMVADITYPEQPEDGQASGVGIANVRELTEGFIYDAAGIFWTPDGSNIIFPSTMDAVGALCIADPETPGVKRLTPEGWWLAFSTPFAFVKEDDGFSLLTSYMSMNFPTELVKVKVAGDGDASFHQLTFENSYILNQLDEVKCERLSLPLDNGETLYSWVLYPAGFDPAGKYPGIEMFNGGPQTSLDQTWSYRWNFRMMCQQGYVVVLPARHGDSGFGQEWKEQISGDYQGLNMEDYQVAGRWFKEQPWAGKLAGVGASYGGFSVYNMMGIHDDLYDCFISHAGIFDEKIMWYTTEEAWFGNWDNGGLKEYAYEEGQVGPAGDGITFGGLQQAGAPYASGAKVAEHYGNDPEAKVTKWHTPILCMHGMMDFRIPYTQGMAAFAAAQMMGVPSRLVIFPEECHWILQPQNAMLWHNEFFGWLERWCK